MLNAAGHLNENFILISDIKDCDRQTLQSITQESHPSFVDPIIISFRVVFISCYLLLIRLVKLLVWVFHAACSLFLNILCDISENIDSLPFHLSTQVKRHWIWTAFILHLQESRLKVKLRIGWKMTHWLLNQIPQSPCQEISLWMDQRKPRINQVEFNRWGNKLTNVITLLPNISRRIKHKSLLWQSAWVMPCRWACGETDLDKSWPN